MRNRVWKKLWQIKSIQNNFRDRILSYRPSLIINACTSSLTDRILDYLSDIPYFNNIPNIVKTYHPAINWKKKELSKIENTEFKEKFEEISEYDSSVDEKRLKEELLIKKKFGIKIIRKICQC